MIPSRENFRGATRHIWATGPQYLMKHSASSEGLYYNNAQLAYLNDAGLPVFSANWVLAMVISIIILASAQLHLSFL